MLFLLWSPFLLIVLSKADDHRKVKGFFARETGSRFNLGIEVIP